MMSSVNNRSMGSDFPASQPSGENRYQQLIM